MNESIEITDYENTYRKKKR